jgi:hypothetical protein
MTEQYRHLSAQVLADQLRRLTRRAAEIDLLDHGQDEGQEVVWCCASFGGGEAVRDSGGVLRMLRKRRRVRSGWLEEGEELKFAADPDGREAEHLSGVGWIDGRGEGGGGDRLADRAATVVIATERAVDAAAEVGGGDLLEIEAAAEGEDGIFAEGGFDGSETARGGRRVGASE